jgi:hypothetical protein
MIPAMDTRTAARILDLADAPAARGGSRSREVATFSLILLLAAHAAPRSGFPDLANSAAMSPAGAGSRARESDHMKQLMAIGVAAAMAGSATAQNAVQWRVQDGGNGHWYAISVGQSGWAAARGNALSIGADLASMETNPEWLWVRSWLPSMLHGYWLGARQIPNSPTPSAGWRWLTGGPVDQAWMVMDDNPCGSSPPGVEDMQQDFMHTCCEFYPQGWSWGDLDDLGGWGCDLTLRALLEWSADCNADGIVDYGQILSGQLRDLNNNGVPDCCEGGGSCNCPGDTNNDRSVDGIDLATILTRWGQSAAKFPAADCNNDGAIDGNDLAIVLAGWGGCP